MASVNKLDKKIQNLEDEIQILKEEKSKREKQLDIKLDIKTLEDKRTAKEQELDKLLSGLNPHDNKAAQPRIEQLKSEIAELDKDIRQLKLKDESPEGIETLEKEIAALTKQIEEKEKELKYLRELTPLVGQTRYHWCYGPVKVLSVGEFIHCQILDVDGVREPEAVKWLKNPPYEPYKRWMPDALDVWLFKEADKVVCLDPTQQHKFYD